MTRPSTHWIAPLALFGLGSLVIGCGDSEGFTCSEQADCAKEGMIGVCEPQGFCSFLDDACASGKRFDDSAGDGLAGQCVDTAQLSIDPPTHDFGAAVLDQPSAGVELTVTNDGQTPTSVLTARAIGPGAADFQIDADDCAGSTLGVGEQCAITVSFAPQAAGDIQADIEVEDGIVSATTAVTGLALNPSDLAVEAISHDFGDTAILTTPGVNQVFEVTNTGDVATGLLEASLDGGDAGEFRIVGGCVGSTLPAGDSCQLEVAFEPTLIGDRSTTVVVQDADKPGEGSSISLSGRGTVTFELTLDNLANSPGVGSVVSVPDGIACQLTTTGMTGTCAFDFASTPITLIASPQTDLNHATEPRSKVHDWSCGLLESCEFALGSTATVQETLTFRIRYQVTSSFQPGLIGSVGSGTIEWSTGAVCSTVCSQEVELDTNLTLTATPDLGSAFTFWLGNACSGSDPVCAVSVTGPIDALTARAGFETVSLGL